MTESRRRPTVRASRGFTFIEVLIVMAIIATLVGLSVVAIQIFLKNKPETITSHRVHKVRALIDRWKTRYDFHPPMDVKGIHDVTMVGAKKVKAPANQTNLGIEAVYQALYWPGFDVEAGLADDEAGNTDDDQLDEAINTRGHKGLFEIIDGYGHPLIYIHKDHYAKSEDKPFLYVNVEGFEVEARAWKSEHGGYVQPNSYQLFSMGADGEPNTDDDIKYWE